MKQLDLFAGIGGISLAAEWAGIETVAFCEKEPFAQGVLRRRFPGRPIYDDVFHLTREVLERDNISGIDIVAGGFPCQPFSHAGKRTGTADDRYLWPEMCRIVGELRPSWVFAENVDGLVSMAQSDWEFVMEDETAICEEAEMVLETIRKDLADIGYQSFPIVVPACGVGASHRRYRIFILGYAERSGCSGDERWQAEEEPKVGCEDVADSASERCGETREHIRRSPERPPGSRKAMADAALKLSYGGRREGRRRDEHPNSCEALADSNSTGRQERDAPAVSGGSGYGARGGNPIGADGPAQPGVGGGTYVLSDWLDGCGVNPLDGLRSLIELHPQPALMGQEQHDWEPPRVATGVKNRTARLKALGNAVVPLQALPVLYAIRIIHEHLHKKGRDTMSDYDSFIYNKRAAMPPSGFSIDRDSLHPSLFDFQRDLVRWALLRGRAAIFAGTGLGKTRMQVEWAMNVHRLTGGDVLMLAPLAVAAQTVREAAGLSYEITMCRSQGDVRPGLNIANYEMLHKFEPEQFVGIVLDESSILKSFTGKLRTELIESFAATPYRLACTATPAPNDYMEIGNHAEFLGVMSRSEMLSMFFVHDGGETQKWRLKGHAEDAFWKWVASWGVVLEKPSDLGYPDEGYLLPPLTVEDFVIDVGGEPAKTLSERQRARRETVEQRVAAAAEIVNASDRPFLVWCDLNVESEMLAAAIPGAVEVKGGDKPAHKEQAMLDFAAGNIRVLVTKPSIAGFGMNWQHCADMVFVGLSDSFEQVFQAIRRCYRFGQTRPVNVHMITSSREGATAGNIKRKEADFRQMVAEMVQYTKDITSESIRQAERDVAEYQPVRPMIVPPWLRSERFAS